MQNSGKEKKPQSREQNQQAQSTNGAKSVNRTEAHISERGAIYSTSNVNKVLSDFFFGFFS